MRRGVFSSISPEDGIRSGHPSVGAWSPVPAVPAVPAGRRSRLRQLEGRQVSVTLKDGTRLSGCTLVSAGRSRTSSLWLVVGGLDTFVAVDDVAEIDAAHAEASLLRVG